MFQKMYYLFDKIESNQMNSSACNLVYWILKSRSNNWLIIEFDKRPTCHWAQFHIPIQIKLEVYSIRKRWGCKIRNVTPLFQLRDRVTKSLEFVSERICEWMMWEGEQRERMRKKRRKKTFNANGTWFFIVFKNSVCNVLLLHRIAIKQCTV